MFIYFFNLRAARPRKPSAKIAMDDGSGTFVEAALMSATDTNWQPL